MQITSWNSLTSPQQKALLSRPVSSSSSELKAQTRAILESVKKRGDEAIKEYSLEFDKRRIESLAVSKDIILKALEDLAPDTREALELARGNIERFHRQQLPRRIELPTQAGFRCFRESRPIEKIGFYIPGGTAPLPSTVLMLGVPSYIIGNPLRVLCTPPQANGEIDPVVLAAAALCGIDKVFRVGGAQAIAAMAYGTESIPKIDKIFGPGNAWVTEAKLQVAADPLGAVIDMPAGPSELLVIADASADPRFVAADLLSQAEHGPDSQVLLVTTDEGFALRCLAALEGLLPHIPRRALAEKALGHSRCIIAPELNTAMDIANAYAPEHLSLQVLEPELWSHKVQNAGSVFLGPWSPESAGDYASGTNHVLPTYGYARAISGLSIESFMKQISFQHISREGLRRIGPAVERLAQLEGLEAHRLAVSIRLRGEET
ncbi:MAG: histidinol dehydrogenase [Proteobacteria bacterium]|nr:histidinol dehydrogenase [Pseudomonadota bacterium]